MERTLILVKPDGVSRGLAGEILRRFEQTGLKLIALKMIKASKDHMSKHYGEDPDWISGMGNKTLENYAKQGIDPVKEVGSNDPLIIGKKIREWLVVWMASGPVVAAVFEGNDAVEIGKKLAGNTLPVYAGPGTVRGDFSTESATAANAEKRPIQNLIHISGNLKDASHEVKHWFPEIS
jgi:nucleoside-diphosphate kinase